MALFVLGALSVTLLSVGSSEVQIAGNHYEAMQARYVAESGVERAIRDFVANPSRVSAAQAAAVTLFTKAALGGVGRYDVSYWSVGFDTVKIRSTGQTVRGRVQGVVEAVVTTQYIAENGLMGDKQVKLGGEARVKGERGSIHSNKKTSVSSCSGLCVTLTATSSGSECSDCKSKKKVANPAGSGPRKPAVKYPTVYASDFLDQADYILQDDGKVLEVKAGKVHDPGKEGWEGWRMREPGKWVNTSDYPLDGVYYASRYIKVKGNPGYHGRPWRVTLLVGSEQKKGHVKIYGAGVMEPAIEALLIVATKIKIKWKDVPDDPDEPDDAWDPDPEGEEGDHVHLVGTIVASSYNESAKEDEDRGKIKLGKKVTLYGNIIAHGKISVKGATIIYDGLPHPRMVGPLRVLAWSSSPR
jgi:hypothetical protein